MVAFGAKWEQLLNVLCLTFVYMTAAQYENYRLFNFPKDDLKPITTAYGLALDHHAAENWTESIKYLKLSLRLNRLLRDSVRYCVVHCNGSKHEEPDFGGNPDLLAHWHVLMSASCQKKCRDHFPMLELSPPSRLVAEEFDRRAPYRYLHHAYSKLNDLQRAVPCLYTYLQRNPEDQQMRGLMEGYRTQYDLSGYLTDHEALPHEASFLRAVTLIDSGDFNSSVGHMEEALRLYLHEHQLCQADCEGIHRLSAERDYYAAITDVYTDILQCQLRCEDNLRPNVGGYFVEKFVATMYHYLQYAYYKLNEGHSAVPCAYSYFLFEPDDQVMKKNLEYYKAYSEQWSLQPEHFTPRMEAFKLFNQTATQKRMLNTVQKYLEMGDEDFFGAEEAARLAPESPDVEFEGMGDYEEAIYSEWRQAKGKGDAGQPNI